MYNLRKLQFLYQNLISNIVDYEFTNEAGNILNTHTCMYLGLAYILSKKTKTLIHIFPQSQ